MGRVTIETPSEYGGNKTLGTLRCMIGLHPWTRWSEPKETQVYDADDYRPLSQKLPIYSKFTQGRVCTCCRRVSTRTWKVS